MDSPGRVPRDPARERASDPGHGRASGIDVPSPLRAVGGSVALMRPSTVSVQLLSTREIR